MIEKIIEELEVIKNRNRRVEFDKAWETSWTRRVAVAISTYILAVVFLFVIGTPKPLLSAIFPACAYILSTLSMGLLKEWWIKNKK